MRLPVARGPLDGKRETGNGKPSVARRRSRSRDERRRAFVPSGPILIRLGQRENSRFVVEAPHERNARWPARFCEAVGYADGRVAAVIGRLEMIARGAWRLRRGWRWRGGWWRRAVAGTAASAAAGCGGEIDVELRDCLGELSHHDGAD